MRKILIFTVIILGIFFLATCDNGISLIDEIETEVKVANDKFLIIKSVSPADLGSNVNPGSEIIVVFDRELDLDSVTGVTFSVYNETSSSKTGFEAIEFNKATNTLTVEPTGTFFENQNNYTIHISGLKGRDGSGMQSEYIWSFKTGIAPAGTIVAVDNDGTAEAGFTSGALVDVSANSFNLYVDEYFVSGIESDLSDPTSIIEGDWKPIAEDFTNVAIVDTEGVVPVYCVFRGELPDLSIGYSGTEKYNIVLDKTAPTVSIGSGTLYENIANAASNPSVTATGSDTNSIAGFTYSWATTSGTAASFGSPASATTTVTTSVDTTNSYFRAMVMDAAGNVGNSDTRSFVRDTIAPTTSPVLTTYPASPTTDETPTWIWSASTGATYYKRALYRSGYSPSYVTTVDTNYTASSLSYVSGYYFRVYAYDDAGNSAPSYIYDYFSLTTTPVNKATGVSRVTGLDWPSYYGATSYSVYVKEDGATRFIRIYTGTKSSILSQATLPPFTKIYWYYTAVSKTGTYTSPEFNFTTALK